MSFCFHDRECGVIIISLSQGDIHLQTPILSNKRYIMQRKHKRNCLPKPYHANVKRIILIAEIK